MILISVYVRVSKPYEQTQYMQSMQAAVVSAAHQRPAALLREVPSARRPPSAGKMPNPPEESPRDFLLLSEFSEQVGPVPVVSASGWRACLSGAG